MKLVDLGGEELRDLAHRGQLQVEVREDLHPSLRIEAGLGDVRYWDLVQPLDNPPLNGTWNPVLSSVALHVGEKPNGSGGEWARLAWRASRRSIATFQPPSSRGATPNAASARHRRR